jgi:hypothetical protein
VALFWEKYRSENVHAATTTELSIGAASQEQALGHHQDRNGEKTARRESVKTATDLVIF